MPSIIFGLEYDLFISYRHKDNKYDGWVTEFVDNLSKELESTFKESITIYFDRNPHDGLRENDDVDESLKPKLRCGVFIPIVSQTYCDKSSFAWSHELLPFVKMASEDNFGIKVRGPRGNVASRVLPIRIHEIDIDDRKLFESATGSAFRPIDFVYRTVGVNRPLRAVEEDPRANLEHTYYRNQINKVAAAIKEVLVALGSGAPGPVHAERLREAKSARRQVPTVPILAGSFLLVLLIALFIFTRGSNTSDVETQSAEAGDVNPSIAVLPFADMSAEHDQEYFADGLSEELLNLLSKVPELRVISRTSAFSFKGKNEDVRSIARKLEVGYVLEGSVRKEGQTVRITAQLINAGDGSHLWSDTYDRSIQSIFKVQDEIATAVVEQLKLRLFSLNNARARDSKPDVYSYWMEGRHLIAQHGIDGVARAEVLFKTGYAIDSTDARISSGLALAEYIRYQNGSGSMSEMEVYMRKAMANAQRSIRLDPNLAEGFRLLGICLTATMRYKDAEVVLARAYQLEPNNAAVISSLANLQSAQGKLDEAEVNYLKAISLEPLRYNPYLNYAWNLIKQEKYDKARFYAQKVLHMNPNHTGVNLNLAMIYQVFDQPDSALLIIQSTKDEFWETYINALANTSVVDIAKGDAALQELISKYSDIGAFQISEVYACRNNREEAMHWLQVAEKQRDPGILEMVESYHLRKYRDDPRFQTVLRNRDMATRVDERVNF